jgi:catechol 2,3-dioxygenase
MSQPAEDRVLFRPRRLGHANLWVEDLKRSESFYNRVCGLTIEFWEPDLVATFLGTGNTPHDLGMIQTTGGKARYGRNGLLQIPEGVGVHVGLGHLAWELENEVQLVDAYQRARRAEVKLDLTVDHQVAHSVYLFDPDDNYMEYYCDTVKDWRKILHGEMELITSAWTPGETEPSSESLCEENPELRFNPDSPVHPRRVTHGVLLTDNLERLTRFYTTVGGLGIVHRDDGVVWLRGSLPRYLYNLVICQRRGAPGEPAGFHHVSFELENEAAVETAERELRQRGIEPEKTIDHPTKRGFFLLDPDGLRSEYYARRSAEFAEIAGEAPEARAFLV